jgi:hypothetical protein
MRRWPRQGLSSGNSTELVTKWTATFLLIVYSAGFLIWSLHDARYGIVEFELLRPKIFLTGFVFVALVTLPIAARHFRLGIFTMLDPVLNNTDPAFRRQRLSVLNSGVVFVALIMAVPSKLFLFVPDHERHAWWHTLIVCLALVAVIVLQFYCGKTFSEHPHRASLWSITGSFGLLALVNVFGSAVVGDLALFFLVAAYWSFEPEFSRPVQYALHFGTWFFFVALVLFYVTRLFPLMEAKVGGGAPTSVVLYLSAAVPWLESSVADAYLVDENERGFYILTSPKGKAFFLPRSSVASIYFGTKDDLAKSK